ncbi:4'-phosphopantetheinyl transferase superfamily protein [uncultured Pelagimonas sp.]|uniref:4'-phosphopantetheinyl transferase family protein n=1 Tax=uncultured Pelagimonas sp. TaxID=1618102 RepID=UPI00261E83CA|nr:4'-phosphopantetheinyl transferase superfamily protein [uncultured Pelagimonas sp.]
MSPEAESIRTLLAQADLPLGLAWGLVEPVDDPTLLFPDEAKAIAKAVPNRRAEFTGGRAAARKAMWSLGVHPAPVPMAENRSPVWPDGLTGSITHADEICMAAVANATEFSGVGIDLEPDVPMDFDLVAEICTEEDLQGVAPADQLLLPKRIFSAKEAVYKAHYALAGVVYGYQAMTVDLKNGRAHFTEDAEAQTIPLAWRGDLGFQQWICDGMILSLCTIPR